MLKFTILENTLQIHRRLDGVPGVTVKNAFGLYSIKMLNLNSTVLQGIINMVLIKKQSHISIILDAKLPGLIYSLDLSRLTQT